MNLITPPGLEPGGERVERVIDGVGTLVFEDFKAGQWLTQRGEPAKTARRRYLLDGEELDSVSSIVGALDKPALLRWIENQATIGAVRAERLGELAGVPEQDWAYRVKSLGLGASAKKEEGADRGTIIHSAMESLTRGEVPNPADVPGIARPWVQGAVKAWLALDPEPLLVEEIVCHPELRYAGRPDLVAVVDGKLTLLDYKSSRSGRVYEHAHFQTRLYAMALRYCGVAVDRIILVGIGNDGGFEIVDCGALEKDAVALVRVYQARRLINADMAAQRRAAERLAA